MRRVDQILLHIGGESIEAQGPARGIGEDDAEGSPVFEEGAKRSGFLPVAALFRFGKGASQEKCDDGECRAEKNGMRQPKFLSWSAVMIA